MKSGLLQRENDRHASLAEHMQDCFCTVMKIVNNRSSSNKNRHKQYDLQFITINMSHVVKHLVRESIKENKLLNHNTAKLTQHPHKKNF